jgi:ABC-type glycerol-3-phosphate transport system substrate-binding protein
MFKFAASLFLALAVLASPAQGQQMTLNVSYSSGAYTAMFQETARSFEAKHPNIKIAYRAPVVATYDELIQQTLRAQITGDLPDVSFQGNQNIKFLAQRGLPVQLDPLIAREASWDELGYSPSVKAVGGGRLTGRFTPCPTRPPCRSFTSTSIWCAAPVAIRKTCLTPGRRSPRWRARSMVWGAA